jgi:hypothetical protein
MTAPTDYDTLAATYLHRDALATLGSRHAGVRVAVTIVGVRRDAGRIRLLVRPITGEGEVWLNADAVVLTRGGGREDTGERRRATDAGGDDSALIGD